jgi:excisionase family DNA binding protein
MLQMPLTVDQAAKFLGIAKSRLYELIHLGKIVHHRPGGPNGKIVFYPEDIERFRKSVRIASPEDHIRLMEAWK